MFFSKPPSFIIPTLLTQPPTKKTPTSIQCADGSNKKNGELLSLNYGLRSRIGCTSEKLMRAWLPSRLPLSFVVIAGVRVLPPPWSSVPPGLSGSVVGSGGVLVGILLADALPGDAGGERLLHVLRDGGTELTVRLFVFGRNCAAAPSSLGSETFIFNKLNHLQQLQNNHY